MVILQVYDRVIPNDSRNTLALLLIGLALVLVLDALLNMLRNYLAAWRGAKIHHFLSCAAVQRMLDGDLKAFETTGPGVHLHRFNGVETISGFHAGQEIHLLIDLPFAILFVGLIAAVSVDLALVLLGVIAALALCGSVSGVCLRRAIEDRSRADDARHNFVIELLRGIHTAKTLGAEALMERRHERLQATAAETNYSVVLHSALARVIGSVFSQLVIFAVAAYGALLAMDGRLTVGSLAACIFLAGRSAQPLLRAMGIWTRFQSISVARRQLAELFGIPAEKRGNITDTEGFRGRITMRDVVFRYRDDSPSVLDGVSLKIEPGEVLGIAGSNGSGKTTLLSLMQGLLQPSEGEVRLDGVDVADYDPETLKRKIVYLPQEGVLFQGTILENLTLFDNARREQAEAIAARLGLAEFVGTLPKGYDTPIRDNPEEGLPIGIRQRIAIARAFATVDEPKLIIFDESNSYLDAAGDEAVRRLLTEYRGTATIVIVTHRPSYLALADRTLVLRAGRLSAAEGGARGAIARLREELSA